MQSILFLDTYDSFTFNLLDIFESLKAAVTLKHTDNFTTEDIIKESYDAIVIGPGPKSPKEIPEVIRLIQTLGPTVPILGICLGHQCIAEAFGGTVRRALKPVHGKSSLIYHEKHPLFEDLENPFTAGRYHSLIVENFEAISPLKVLAKTHFGEIMAICHFLFPIYGVQFHPESILTSDGEKILRNFLNLLV